MKTETDLSAHTSRVVSPVVPLRNGDRYLFVDDASLGDLGEASWLIEGILPTDCIGAVYGLPGTAKSFLALDWAMCIATGKEWLGRSVKTGPVVYVAAEGARGYTVRVAAWKTNRAIDDKAGVHFIREPVQLANKKDIDRLIDSMNFEKIEPVLIVFDTLARCFDGDDNSAKDMSLLVTSASRLKMATGATVLLVHHSRKDDTSYRGSGALHGAVEMMAHVTKSDGLVNINCPKMKDSIQFETIRMRLAPFDDSAILVDAGNEAVVSKGVTNHQRTLALEALNGSGLKYTEWQIQAELAGVPEGSFDRVRKSLLGSGDVAKDDRRRYVRVSDSTTIGFPALRVMADGLEDAA